MDIINSADGESFVIYKNELCKIVGVDYEPDFKIWATTTGGRQIYYIENI